MQRLDGAGSWRARRPVVLVVDDFHHGRELVDDVLSYAGFEVRQAATGPDGLDMARSLVPDLLVLDLNLPGLDGWEVARSLKGDHGTRRIPILALTAHAEASAIQRAREAGCDLIMTKPCAPDDLIAQARQLTNRAVPATRGRTEES